MDMSVEHLVNLCNCNGYVKGAQAAIYVKSTEVCQDSMTHS